MYDLSVKWKNGYSCEYAVKGENVFVGHNNAARLLQALSETLSTPPVEASMTDYKNGSQFYVMMDGKIL